MDAVSCALLPASCTLCGSPLPHFSSVPICNACLSEFSVQSDPRCARCGDLIDPPLASVPETNVCRACRLAPPPFFRAVACGPYEGRMRDAIHALKYRRMHAASRLLGPMLAAAIDRLGSEAPAEMLVVPIPLFRSKHTARGFNQARLLAVHAIRSLRRTNPNWRLTLAPRALMRVRATKSQAGLTTRQRRQNLRGAFRVSDPSVVAGRHVLVIDDIFTTGATARAAAQALANAGAAGVWVATLARAGRLYSNSRVLSADLQSAQARRGTPGSTLAGSSQIEGIDSSPNQPSF
jgi:ComF family protein